MNKSTLNKIWTIVHLAAIYAGVNAILFLQKSPVTLPMFANIQEQSLRGKESMAVFWVYLVGAPLICSLALALTYLKMHGKAGLGENPAPVMFGIDLKPGTRLSQCYQALFLVVLIVLSLWGVAHATHTVLKADLYECSVEKGSEGHEFRNDQRVISGLLPRFDGKSVRFGSCSQPDGSASRRGVVYVPIVNDVLPALITLLSIGMAFLFWTWWYRLANRNPKSGTTR